MDNTLTLTRAVRLVAQLARHAKQPIIAQHALLADSQPIPKASVSLFAVMVIYWVLKLVILETPTLQDVLDAKFKADGLALDNPQFAVLTLPLFNQLNPLSLLSLLLQ